jgi:hypothetical protein
MGLIEGLLVGAIIAIIGLVVCFSGYGFWRIALVIGGFISGYALGASIVPDSQWLLAIIVGVVVAIVGGVLAYFLWSLGMVVAGLIFGAAIGAAAMVALGIGANADGSANIIAIAAAVIGGLLGAILVYAIKDLAVIIFLAFGGAAAVSLGVQTMLPFLSDLANPGGGVVATILGLSLQVFNLIVIIGLGLLGTLVQWVVYRARFTGELYFEQPATATTTTPYR